MKHTSWLVFVWSFLIFLIDPVVHFAQSPLYPVTENGRWGMMDSTGQTVIAAEYTFVQELKGDFIKVGGPKGQGMIDRRGNVLLPAQYDAVFERGDSIIWYRKAHRWGFKHVPSGRSLPPRYRNPVWFLDSPKSITADGDCPGENCGKILHALITPDARELLAPQEAELSYSGDSLVILSQNKRYGMLHLPSGQRIEPEYQLLIHLGEFRFLAKKDQRFHLLDMQGNPLIDRDFALLEKSDFGWLRFEDEDVTGLISQDNTLLSDSLYPNLVLLGPNEFGYWQNGRWGIFHADGSAILPPAYTSLEPLGNAFVALTGESGMGAVNLRGDTVIAFRYLYVQQKSGADGFVARSDSGFTWLHADGSPSPIVNVREIGTFRRGMATYRTERGFGIFNEAGSILVPAQYERFVTYENRIVAHRGEETRTFYLGEDGELLTGNRFILVKGDDPDPDGRGWRGVARVPVRFGWFWHGSSGMYGLRDTLTGDTLIPPRYHFVIPIPGTDLTFTRRHYAKKDHFGLVNHQQGRELIKPVLPEIYYRDFVENDYARVTLANGRRTLVHKSGRPLPSKRVRYIGPFVNGVARVMVDGLLVWDTKKIPSEALEERQVRQRGTTFGREYMYARKGKWGYLRGDGTWLVKPKYDFAGDYQRGIAMVRNGEFWGVLDSLGEVLVPLEMERLQSIVAGNTSFVRTQRSNGHVGYLDLQGNPVTPGIFQDGQPFSEGLAAVKIEDKWGYIDQQGNWAIPARYDAATAFREGRARVREGYLWKLIDDRGNPVSSERFVRAGDFHEGLAWAEWGGRAGYLDQNGKWAIEPRFYQAQDFHHGLAVVRMKGGYGMINRHGEVVVKPRFRRIGAFRDGMAVALDKRGYLCLDSTGLVISKGHFRKMGPFSEGMAWVREKNWSGYIDRSGEVVIKGYFRELRDFSDGLAAVRTKKGWGFIDRQGNMVVEPQYVRIRDFAGGYAPVLKKGGWRVIDRTGQDQCPPMHDIYYVGAFADGMAVAQTRAGRWIYLDTLGNQITGGHRNGFDGATSFQNGLANVQVDGVWQMVNRDVRPVVRADFAAPFTYSEGLAAARFGREYGLIDRSGNVLLTAEYDQILPSDGFLQIFDASSVGYLRPDGNWVRSLPGKGALGSAR
jgi:hypothetical protein